MVLNYSNIEEFENTYDNYETAEILNETKCDCGSYYEMHLDTVEVTIGEYYVLLVDCPTMVCTKCGKQHLCPDIPQEIYTTYFRLTKNGFKNCKLTMKSDIRYEFAKTANFIYDSRDMSIPGLGVDLDPTNPKGFSCPVYFDRKVLNNFFTDNDYELDFFSESYGSIAKKGTDGWQYEWKIVFGINKNDTDLNNSSKYLHLLYDGEEIKFAACNKSFGEGMKVDLSESLAAYYMAPEPKWLSVDSSMEIFENIWKYKLKYLFGTVTKTNKKIRDTCLMALDDFKSSTQMHKNILIEVKQLKIQLNGITAELNKASELLQQAYDVNIVPSQFRNLYAIYYLADFINTSNESLSNALLNYNLEKIKEKLDRIIEQQEEIIINQALMTVQNENIMKQNEQQLRHLASIEQNFDRAAQYAQIAANNAEACAWIGVANYISK